MDRGEASFTAELKDGVITIKHGGGGETLAEWTTQEGDWDNIWVVIRALEAGNTIAIKEF